MLVDMSILSPNKGVSCSLLKDGRHLYTLEGREFLSSHVSKMIDTHYKRHARHILIVLFDHLIVLLEYLVFLVSMLLRSILLPVLSYKVDISLNNFLILSIL